MNTNADILQINQTKLQFQTRTICLPKTNHCHLKQEMELSGIRNLSYIQQIINVVEKELAQFFIKQWNSRYKSTDGEWDDTKNSGKKFCTLESGRKLDKELQLKYQDGDTSKWGCTILFDAIIFSNSIGKHLDTKTKDAVHALRCERNKYAHWYERECSDDDFDEIVNTIEKSFQDLEFSLDEIIEIKNHRRCFNSFYVLPSKPNHFFVERTELRDKIIKDLEKLRNDNNDKLTYFYISGNPGSDGKNKESLLKTYYELEYRLNCDKHKIKQCENEICSITDKVKNLRSLVSTRLKFWQNWLIIVGKVVQLRKISSLLPQVGDPMWRNGQIIVTIQNTDAVPQDDEFNKHISIRSGMNDRECFQLLKHYTIENANDQLLNEVSHALDRQPLALAAAGDYVSRALEIRKQSLGPNHVDVAASLNNLGNVLKKTRNYDKAKEVHEKALEIRKQALGQNHVDVAQSLNNLGIVYYDTGNYDKTIKAHEKALQIRKQLLGPNHVDVAASLNGNYDKAIEFYEKALETRKQSLGPNHVEVADTLNNLGLVFNKTGNYDKAIEVHEKALKIRKRSLGFNHVDVAASLYNLGIVLNKTGNYEKAIEVHEKALGIRKQSLGVNHVDVAPSLNNLGLVYFETGNYNKAIEVHKKRKLNQHRESVKNHITQTDAKYIDETIKETTNAYRTKRHNELQRKLQKSRSFKEINTDTHSWVKNISSKPLTVQPTKILSKGLNYNIKDANKLDFVADLESTLKFTNLSDEIKEDIRHKVTTNLCLKRPVTLNNEEQKAIRNLRNNEDIVILPADKGRKTVIMDKSDYINKAKTLLQDTNTYEPLQTDPNKTTTNHINKKLKQLKAKRNLTKPFTKESHPTTPPPPNSMDYQRFTKKATRYDQSYLFLDLPRMNYQNIFLIFCTH
ncbi:uncharacterized protein LOC124448981 [Xenia sp. Carnegie-2017]|uniref:uncharacterized protein LOC124448981 n=1 Tax=Xenia sp. Carnegie-2017 TaxID=2897299 RepID=UPI001F0363F0|nr:uncharacterized protein LOC124448981 [Xenia sp. Carnegie-2017]